MGYFSWFLQLSKGSAIMSGVPQMDDQTAATMNQFKEFLLSYNKVSEACFNDCAHDFTSRKVQESESSCALNCMEKYLKVTQRISQRFQEFQMQSSENNQNSILQKMG